MVTAIVECPSPSGTVSDEERREYLEHVLHTLRE